jgi:cytochrome P450
VNDLAAKKTPPGPKSRLITGNMREFNRDTLGFLDRCAREYGDVVRARFLHIPTYFLFNPEHIEYLLASGSNNFVKLRFPLFRQVVGNGLITSEGEFWRRQRGLSQPSFHRERIASYGRTMVELIEGRMAGWSDGTEINLHDEMVLLTLQIVAATLFSSDVSNEVDNVGQALDRIVYTFRSTATLRWFLDNSLPTPNHLRFKRDVKEIDRFVYRIIGERRASGQDTGDLLSMLLRAQDDAGAPMSDRQLRDEVITIFLAGFETTSVTLLWAWILLSQNPDVEDRLGSELSHVLGERPPTVADLPQLRYVDWIVKETLRLYPPIHGIAREAANDCEVGGYPIRRGSYVSAFPWVVHHDARWYDEPLKFRPERWGEEKSSHLPRFAYFPFGGGPRICIGNTFALMEAVLVLSTIGQRFRLRRRPGKIELVPALTLRPSGDMRVRLERR